MDERRNPLGATGETVRANVKRLREQHHFGYAELSRRVKATGRTIPELGLRRIEEGRRRVDADDLMALAAALDVSPATLLMPLTDTADETIDTAVGPMTARQCWQWLSGSGPLSETPQDVFGFFWRAVPNWLLGNEIQLVESGLPPHRTHSVRRREQTTEVNRGDD